MGFKELLLTFWRGSVYLLNILVLDSNLLANIKWMWCAVLYGVGELIYNRFFPFFLMSSVLNSVLAPRVWFTLLGRCPRMPMLISYLAWCIRGWANLRRYPPCITYLISSWWFVLIDVFMSLLKFLGSLCIWKSSGDLIASWDRDRAAGVALVSSDSSCTGEVILYLLLGGG